MGFQPIKLSLDQSAVLTQVCSGAPEIATRFLFGRGDQSPQYGPQNMVAAGYIDQKTADQSAAVDIHGQLVDAYEGKDLGGLPLPSIFDAVINEAVNEVRPDRRRHCLAGSILSWIKITKQVCR